MSKTQRLLKDGSVYSDYTPTSAVDAGDVVVQGTLAGFADSDISANRQGALGHDGIRRFPKASTSGSAIAVGKKVYWDATNEQATETVGSNAYLGKTVAAAADSDTTVDVLTCPAGS